jgi:hypothetical protein
MSTEIDASRHPSTGYANVRRGGVRGANMITPPRSLIAFAIDPPPPGEGEEAFASDSIFKQPEGHALAFSEARCAQAVRDRRPPGRTRGRRECRVPRPHPQPCVRKVRAHKLEVTTGTPNIPAFPARWFYGFLRALPGDRAFLSPSSARCRASSPTWRQRRGARTTRLRRPRLAHSSLALTASIASRAPRS